ncbi:Dabb family protein [Roseivirga pacifica]|jgi:uncharacterized lipoprotein YmbA|uniref:Dabb family protein n=1 Tax=Roseivirga pacifica TaxID=1267423 RepID=UPI003BAB4A45
MKKLLLCITIALIMTACSSNTVPAEGLRHVVSFKFKPSASQEQVNALIQAFEGLQKDIPQIKAFEWGLNNSPEGFDKGMTHIFQLTFENAKARDEYLPHPAHKAFGDTHGGIIEDLVVVDYIIE